MGKQAEKTKKSIICYKDNVIMKDQKNKKKRKKKKQRKPIYNIYINTKSLIP